MRGVILARSRMAWDRTSISFFDPLILPFKIPAMAPMWPPTAFTTALRYLMAPSSWAWAGSAPRTRKISGRTKTLNDVSFIIFSPKKTDLLIEPRWPGRFLLIAIVLYKHGLRRINSIASQNIERPP